MKELNLILIFTLFSSSVLGQDVKIIDQNDDFNKTEEFEYFEYVLNEIDISNNLKVATLKGFSANSGSSTYVELFNSFWKTANELGANSFKIDSFSNNSSDTVYVTISIFKLGEEELDENFSLYPKNKIYVFGDLNNRRQRGKAIRLNNERIRLFPFEYVAYQNKVGETTTVSFGGIFGAKIWIQGRKDRMPTL